MPLSLLGEVINKSWQNAMAASAHDQTRVAENKTAAALTNRGYDAGTAQAVGRNPAMLRAIMGQGFRPQARAPSLQSNTWLRLRLCAMIREFRVRFRRFKSNRNGL